MAAAIGLRCAIRAQCDRCGTSARWSGFDNWHLRLQFASLLRRTFAASIACGAVCPFAPTATTATLTAVVLPGETRIAIAAFGSGGLVSGAILGCREFL